MTRSRETAVVELSAEHEELAQRVYQRLKGRMDEELLAMVRLMMSKPNHEIFGPGEFELREKLNAVGATILEESANERAKSKKGVLR
jgi:tRNA A37 N6-isopentenylltransferase MiaA